MTSYAELIYETAGMLLADAAHLERHVPDDGKHPAVDGAIRRMREHGNLILEALRTAPADNVLSVQAVVEELDAYHPADFDKLADSHEALRTREQTAQAVTDRLMKGWRPDLCTNGIVHRWVSPHSFIPGEDMTPAEQAYFAEHEDERL